MDGTPGSSATRAAPYSLARRRIVRGLAVTALGGTLLSRGAVLGADRAGTASCGGNAGVEMVRMWSLGGFPVPPTRALPGPTWVLYAHPTVPQISFLYPPDWTATTLFDPVWAGVRLESPDRQAALEGASAALPVIGLTARQAAAHGLERLLTAASVVTTLCVDDLPSPAGPAAGLAMSFAAVAAGSRLAAAQGMAGPLPTGTFVLYRALSAPAETFTEIVQAVVLPILYQISAFGQGGGKVTTPTSVS